MESVTDKKAKSSTVTTTTADTAAAGWNPYDEYDCRLDADSPQQTQEYVDSTMPWRKDALAKRQADLAASAPTAVTPEAVPKNP